jgi:hypothetical protein
VFHHVVERGAILVLEARMYALPTVERPRQHSPEIALGGGIKFDNKSRLNGIFVIDSKGG